MSKVVKMLDCLFYDPDGQRYDAISGLYTFFRFGTKAASRIYSTACHITNRERLAIEEIYINGIPAYEEYKFDLVDNPISLYCPEVSSSKHTAAFDKIKQRGIGYVSEVRKMKKVFFRWQPEVIDLGNGGGQVIESNLNIEIEAGNLPLVIQVSRKDMNEVIKVLHKNKIKVEVIKE